MGPKPSSSNNKNIEIQQQQDETKTSTTATNKSITPPSSNSTSTSIQQPARVQPKRKISVFSSTGFPNLDLLDETAKQLSNSRLQQTPPISDESVQPKSFKQASHATRYQEQVGKSSGSSEEGEGEKAIIGQQMNQQTNLDQEHGDVTRFKSGEDSDPEQEIGHQSTADNGSGYSEKQTKLNRLTRHDAIETTSSFDDEMSVDFPLDAQTSNREITERKPTIEVSANDNDVSRKLPSDDDTSKFKDHSPLSPTSIASKSRPSEFRSSTTSSASESESSGNQSSDNTLTTADRLDTGDSFPIDRDSDAPCLAQKDGANDAVVQQQPHQHQTKFESIKNQLKGNSSALNSDAIQRHIDNLISQNEAIVDNWKYISIRSYNHSASKENSHQASASSSSAATSSSTNAGPAQITTTLANTPIQQQQQISPKTTTTNMNRLSTCSSTSSSSSSSKYQNITTTAPSRRSFASCLAGSASLSASPSNVLQRVSQLRHSSTTDSPSLSSFNSSQSQQQQQFQISSPYSSGSDYPTDSTGYSSAGSLSHQSSLCDTTPILSSQQNPMLNVHSYLNRRLSNQKTIPFPSNSPVSPRSRKRSYEVRNRKYHQHNQFNPSSINTNQTTTTFGNAGNLDALITSSSQNHPFNPIATTTSFSTLGPSGLQFQQVLQRAAFASLDGPGSSDQHLNDHYHELFMGQAQNLSTLNALSKYPNLLDETNDIERRWSAACLSNQARFKFDDNILKIATTTSSNSSTTYPSLITPSTQSISSDQLNNESDSLMIHNLSLKRRADTGLGSSDDGSNSMALSGDHSQANSYWASLIEQQQNHLKPYCSDTANVPNSSSTTTTNATLGQQKASLDNLIAMAIAAMQLEHQQQNQQPQQDQAPMQNKTVMLEQHQQLLHDLERFRLTTSQQQQLQATTTSHPSDTINLHNLHHHHQQQYHLNSNTTSGDITKQQASVSRMISGNIENKTNAPKSELDVSDLRDLLAALNEQQQQVQLQLQLQTQREEEQQSQTRILNDGHDMNDITSSSTTTIQSDFQRQLLQRQLPTTGHSAELLTQSLDSTSPAYKCQLCEMSFWTKNLLNYHQTTQCKGIINFLSTNLNLQQEVIRLIQQQNAISANLSESSSPSSPRSAVNRRPTPVPRSGPPTRTISQPTGVELGLLTASLHNQFRCPISTPSSSFNNEVQSSVNLKHPSIKINKPEDIADVSHLQHRLLNQTSGLTRIDQGAMLTDITTTTTPTTTSSSSNQSLGSDLSENLNQERPNSATTSSQLSNNTNNLLPNGYLPLKKRKISAPGFI